MTWEGRLNLTLQHKPGYRERLEDLIRPREDFETYATAPAFIRLYLQSDSVG